MDMTDFLQKIKSHLAEVTQDPSEALDEKLLDTFGVQVSGM